MADFDISRLPKEWQRDIFNRAPDEQKNAIIRYFEDGWEIVQGKFGGDTEMTKNEQMILINQSGQVIGM